MCQRKWCQDNGIFEDCSWCQMGDTGDKLAKACMMCVRTAKGRVKHREHLKEFWAELDIEPPDMQE